jgi:menaquinone-dependent protoporphyrinogen IX oxidase
MKTIVVYKSISGFTEKYARWIAEELDADIENLSEVNKEILKRYDLIIYGGSLHAVGIVGLKKIKKIVSALENKRFVVFSVGASPYKKGTMEEIEKNNFDEKGSVKLFYLRGGFNFSKLNLLNKIIMFTFIQAIKRKKEKSEDEKGLISAYEKPVDFTKKENITELVKYVKNLSK